MIDGSKVGSHTNAENRDNVQIGETGLEMDNAATQMSSRGARAGAPAFFGFSGKCMARVSP